MKIIPQSNPINIVGIEIRTNNTASFKDIPAHWQRFFQAGTMSQIPDKVSNDIYAVYTNFENPGKSNEGTYTFIIGAEVSPSARVPDGLSSTVIPASKRVVFDVAAGHPEKVGEKWMEIWQLDSFDKAYISDYERYKESGEIEIHVGAK